MTLNFFTCLRSGIGIFLHSLHIKDWQPIRQDLAELSIACLMGLDPVQDKLDLAKVKSAIVEQAW